MRVTEPHSTSNRGSCLESRAWRENNNFLYQLVLNIYTYHNYYNYRYLLLTMGATVQNPCKDSLNLYVSRRSNSIFTTGITAPNS
jgi:hypothetical protein